MIYVQLNQIKCKRIRSYYDCVLYTTATGPQHCSELNVYSVFFTWQAHQVNQFSSCLTSHHWLSRSVSLTPSLTVSLCSFLLPDSDKTPVFFFFCLFSLFNTKEAKVTIKAQCVFAVSLHAALTVCHRLSLALSLDLLWPYGQTKGGSFEQINDR